MRGLPKPPPEPAAEAGLEAPWSPSAGLPRGQGHLLRVTSSSRPCRLPRHPPQRWRPSAVPWFQLRGHWPAGGRWQASGHTGTTALSGSGEGAGDSSSLFYLEATKAEWLRTQALAFKPRLSRYSPLDLPTSLGQFLGLDGNMGRNFPAQSQGRCRT